ncbi:MAG: DUF6691 family protein [Pseudomonadales bacterium]
MIKQLFVFLSGLIFSTGLMISGMINPEKVLGFLDVFGDWDASLAFVMGGAVVVTAIGYKIVLKKTKPLFADAFSVPNRKDVDARLILGPIMFGIGWGLVGLCPGPAFAALVVAPTATALFVTAMLLGMFVARRVLTRSRW